MLSLATLFVFLTTANCHTWIEQLTVVAPNGTFVGAPGYIRGNVLRSAPGFGDPLMVNLIPPNGRATGNQILATDPMCKSTQQSQIQTDGSPRLQAAPGDAIALRYQENGHVTLPQNQPLKPPNRGSIYVYGTTDPQTSDTLLAIHKVWNADGTGGDKRGKLLSTSNYDDGRCYQVNGGQISTQRQKEFPHTPNQLMGGDIWCQQDLALPTDTPVGKPYTMYWVWEWPNLSNGQVTLNETYTSCFDADVVASSTSSQKSSGSSFIQNQDLNYAAIPDQMANLGTANAPSASASAGSSSAPSSSSPAASETAAPSQPALTSSAPSAPSTSPTVGPGVFASSAQPVSEQTSSGAGIPVVSAAPSTLASSAQSSAGATPSTAATTSSVLPAVSAMNQPTGPSNSLATVTVTDYVSQLAAGFTVTEFVAASSSTASPESSGVAPLSNVAVQAANTAPTEYRLRARGATLTTVVRPEPTQSKRFFILPSPPGKPMAQAEKDNDADIVNALENLKGASNSAKFRKLNAAKRSAKFRA